MSIPVLLISMMLFLILFFGIGFLLNMILRATWVMVIIYPIVCILIISKASVWDYFSKPKETFSSFGTSVSHLGQADLFILSTGLIGAILSGVVIKQLRKSGYQMF
ncbi:YuiB family protein [Bacillus sp. C1]